MAKNIYGGGSKANVNGLAFEQETSLNDALLNLECYSIDGVKVLYNNKEIGLSVPQTKL